MRKNYWIDLKSGSLPKSGFISEYDELTMKDSILGHPFFTGAKAMAVYGGPLPVTFFSG